MRRPHPLSALRLLALAALALPLTGVFDSRPFTAPRFALVLDTSPSMAKRFPGFAGEALEEWGQVGEGRETVVPFSAHPGDRGDMPAGKARETDLAAALRAAAGLLPPRAERRLLLVTDGLTRKEGLREAAEELVEAGVKVFALSPPGPERTAGVMEVLLPPRAYLWEPFVVKGRVAASSPGTLEVELARNGIVVDSRRVQVDGTGTAEVEFIQESDRVGRILYRLSIPGFGHPPASGAVTVATAPRVRYVTADPLSSRPLIELFRRAGIEVVVTLPSDLFALSRELERDDVVVLDDVPVPALDEAAFDALRRAVGTGGRGLLVIGGRKGLGSPDYEGSPIESLLPVTAGFSAPPEPAPVSMVIALDTSFSMAHRGRGGGSAHGSAPRKIDVAKESAGEVVRVVRPGDRLGIIGNSTDLFWIKDLGEVDDPGAVIARIDGVTARGDGINFYSIVRESYEALREERLSMRHILVFCDAGDIDQYEVTGAGHAFDLIREMAREGVTLSILAIGLPGDKDVPFLRTATLLGRGDFYLVSNLRTLPRYFVSEYRKLSSRSFIEGEVRPLAAEYSRLLHGTENSLPRLEGIALVTPRRGSATPLRTDAGVPLVTEGRYGRGRTAVFASDNGYRWARRWVSGVLAERFWLRLLFAVAPRETRRDSSLSSLGADTARDRIVFRHRAGRDLFPEWEALQLRRLGGGGEEQRLVRTGLVEYRSRDPLPGAGLYRFAVSPAGGEGGQIAEVSLAVPAPREIAPLAADWRVVDDIVGATGGRWVTSAGEITSGAEYYRIDRGLLAALAVTAGLLFLLAETALRKYLGR